MFGARPCTLYLYRLRTYGCMQDQSLSLSARVRMRIWSLHVMAVSRLSFCGVQECQHSLLQLAAAIPLFPHHTFERCTYAVGWLELKLELAAHIGRQACMGGGRTPMHAGACAPAVLGFWIQTV